MSDINAAELLFNLKDILGARINNISLYLSIIISLEHLYKILFSVLYMTREKN